MRAFCTLVLILLPLSSCALSHGRPGEEEDVAAVPTPLVDDWTFASPVCDSFNRLVWITLCEGGRAWLTDIRDYPTGSDTFARSATRLDDGRVRFEPLEAGNAFEPATLALDEFADELVWTERVGARWACGEIESHGRRGRPDVSWAGPLPAHACP